MRYKRTIDSAAFPVHLDDAKRQLFVEHTDDDDQITAYIRAATGHAEMFTRRKFAAATYQMQLSRFWRGALQVPLPPLRAVPLIQYVDQDGDTQTLSTSIYQVDTAGLFGVIYLAFDQSWPNTRNFPASVTITWQGGYAAPFSATFAADTITLSGWTPADDETISLMKTGGESAALPSGLSENTTYHVINSSGSTCQLAATSGGAAIVLTDDGVGQSWFGVVPNEARQAIMLLTAHWYEHRMSVGEERMFEVPDAVESLLMGLRVEL